MKLLLAITLLFLSCSNSLLAQKTMFVEVPPRQNVMEAMKSDDLLYLNPSFVSGTITFKNGKTKSALLNFNILLEEIQMVENDDTLTIDKEKVSSVSFGADRFELGIMDIPSKYLPAGNVMTPFYFRIERDYGKMRLVSKKVFAFTKQEPLPNDSTRFNLQYSSLNDGRFLQNIVPVDTLRLAIFDLFYIANAKNELGAVHRSRLIEMYPYKEKAILDYLRSRTVYPYDKEAVVALLDFVAEKKFDQ